MCRGIISHSAAIPAELACPPPAQWAVDHQRHQISPGPGSRARSGSLVAANLSDPRVVLGGELARHVAGVDGASGLDEHDPALLSGHGLVFKTSRHDEHVTRTQRDVPISEMDRHLAVQDDEDLIGLGMTVPDELALDLDELEVVVVHPGDDLRRPALAEARELFMHVDRSIRHEDLLRDDARHDGAKSITSAGADSHQQTD